jgi:hypothetical protein
MADVGSVSAMPSCVPRRSNGCPADSAKAHEIVEPCHDKR